MPNLARFLVVICILVITGGCGTSASPAAPTQTLNVVTGSENAVIQPILEAFGRKHNVNVRVTYEGSVTQMLQLQQGAKGLDAIWPSSSLWLSLGDTHHLVKYAATIMRSPVVLGVKKSIARQLGWIHKPVRVRDILAAAEAGRFRYMMTSATQSNSGATAYLGYLNAFAGSPNVLTSADLQKPGLRQKIKRILGTINRSSGSSGWLEDLFLKDYAVYDGMVNYEAAIIETNQKLVKAGREPLYAIYPQDGLSIADYPLGYVDHGNHAKEKIFKQFQAYMLSPAVQRRLEALGRRTGAIGLSTGTANTAVFNPSWGIDLKRVLQPVRFPSAPVINQALNLYQEAFRKPSFTVYVLDFSGSMASNGGEDQLKTAMRTLLTQNLAKTYFLQATNRDRNIVVPFSDGVHAVWRVDGNNPTALRSLFGKVNNLSAGGDTSIFSGVETAYKQLKRLGYENYQPAVILMTDGQNNHGISFDELKSYVASHGLRGIPVYALMFGAADSSQLTQLTDLTSGKLFDGRKDLISAFRDAKGYND